jgi:hypothetical protein
MSDSSWAILKTYAWVTFLTRGHKIAHDKSKTWETVDEQVSNHYSSCTVIAGDQAFELDVVLAS